jgi:cytochrome b pre-mRNA-processing protein 3
MAAEVCQTLFDTFLSGLDDGLRQMGVGDLSVGKKMRKLGGALYGRLKAYDDALKPGAEPQDLAALLARTVYLGLPEAPVARLAAYVVREDAALSNADLSVFLGGALPWSQVSL